MTEIKQQLPLNEDDTKEKITTTNATQSVETDIFVNAVPIHTGNDVVATQVTAETNLIHLPPVDASGTTPTSTATTGAAAVDPIASSVYDRAVYHQNASEELKKRNESFTVLRTVLFTAGYADMNAQQRWIPPRDIYVFKAISKYRLDFSMAEFVHNTCTIHIYSAIGKLCITVPPGVPVTSGTVNIIGKTRMRENNSTPHLLVADAVSIHITGLTFVGNVTVEVNNNALPPLVIP